MKFALITTNPFAILGAGATEEEALLSTGCQGVPDGARVVPCSDGAYPLARVGWTTGLFSGLHLEAGEVVVGAKAVTRAQVEVAAAKYGIASWEFSTVQRMADKGRGWIETEAAKLKAAPDHPRKAAVLGMARIAWEVSS
jgi:hypothetical protein